VTRPRAAVAVLLTVAAATLLFWVVLHEISGVWLDVALRPEVRAALEQSLEDQKALRNLDPQRRADYRRRFDETQRLLNRLDVLRMTREAMLRRFELALLAVFAVAAAAASTLLFFRYRRAQERERASYLERVTSLQETARRHAHEIKGPLTAARLELERYADLVRTRAAPADVARAEASVAEELDRLARYTREFSSFAGLGQPVLRRQSIGVIVRDFCTTFAGAWPAVELGLSRAADAAVCADGDMVRQVLVNLCSNSANAGAKRITFDIARASGHVTLDVVDDGGGVPAALRDRLFDPYVTTRPIGQGMGLGLSISRKVMLEHGGDLALHHTSPAGSTFRMTFLDGERACS
jgi:two-component system C4-dicarboxylate transport sensor histidine kinase DctB